ncbi:MAG: D-alanine--D-alanine ligase [Magnetococcales bacterium]|nr:D-alanine--D-alanine ligase [Magnetococcales bacterium]
MEHNHSSPPQGNIAVLMGGRSREREISLKSGRNLVASYQRLGIPVIPIEIDSWKALARTLLERNIQTAVLALHGPGGEDGAVQGLLETLEIPYTGSGIAASAICMDKVLCKRLLRDAGLPTPDWMLARVGGGKIDTIEGQKKPLEAPLFVKPVGSGSSVGVFFLKTLENLEEILFKSAQMGEGGVDASAILVENAVVGAELTLAILDDQPLPVIEVKPEKGFYSYDNKYTAGRTRYLIPPESVGPEVLETVTRLGREAGRTVGCRGLYRVDFMVDHQMRPWILEINTTPGMTATSLAPKAALAAGMDMDTLASRILAGARLDRCCTGC